jgi:hypothetical protein
MKMKTIGLVVGFTVALGSVQARAIDKDKCKAQLDQYFEFMKKNCEKLKKEPLNEGKCHEMMAEQKKKMVKDCDDGKDPAAAPPRRHK